MINVIHSGVAVSGSTDVRWDVLCRTFGMVTLSRARLSLYEIRPFQMDGNMLKQHLEFTAINVDDGWSIPAGYPAGIEEKILCGSLDSLRRTGCRTRLLRFHPGVYTIKPFVHDYWEEVYLLQGDLIVGNDAHGIGGDRFCPHTYACRPPGAFHGPFKSDNGCLLLEIHYYAYERAISE